jgi:hypothetical protein
MNETRMWQSGTNKRQLLRAQAAVLLIGTTLSTAWPANLLATEITAKPPTTKDGRPYSAPLADIGTRRLLWGNTHLHTSNSFDAGLFGTRLGPEDAFRFSRGEEVVSNIGVPAKLARPLDFLVVTDHSDYMGVPEALRSGDSVLVGNPVGKQWYDEFHAKGDGPFKLMMTTFKDISSGHKSLNDQELEKSAWQRAVSAAEKYNSPGIFTALIGFEWSSTPSGDNLHRNVIFRDGADKALQVVPLQTFDSQDPEHLWAHLANYEQKTGGEVLAIPHNSDLSGGLMFSDKTFAGKLFDRAYAEQRAKWEPVVEATQPKGDSETDPSVSPDDEFANFERWDKANIMGSKLDTPEQQPHNYIRPSLTRGLKLEQQLGVNPYKFGLVGGTDQHTGLTTTDANNWFGTMPANEPSAGRTGMPVRKFGGVTLPAPVEESSGGLSGVWAKANTREAIFDALRRKEVYGTTGTRITVREFAGWHFQPGDIYRSDLADYGYANGVPMGGDLSGAKPGEAPTFLIQAAKDPEGANLDRVQVIKGWIDAQGQTHEKIFDVAWSGDRKIDSTGKLPLVGNTVDVTHATYTNSIGAPTFNTAWTDPEFKPDERSYYYLRVIEIPTPRWSTYDSARYGVALSNKVPASITQRAYTSPIWYVPVSHTG